MIRPAAPPDFEVLGLASMAGAYRASCGGNTHLLVPTREDIAQLSPDPQVSLTGEVRQFAEGPFTLG
jgi:hypothetical protein